MTDKQKKTAETTTTDDEKAKDPPESTGAAADDELEDDDEETPPTETDDEEDKEKEYDAARAVVKTTKQLAAAFPKLVGATLAAERARILGIIDLTPVGQESAAREAIEKGVPVGEAAATFLKNAGTTANARFAAFAGQNFTPPKTEAPKTDDPVASTARAIVEAGRLARGETANRSN